MFTSKSRAADLDPSVRAVARLGHEAGIFCDFDGSLSPIVLDPEKAHAVPGAARALHACAKRFGVVAVISGRPVRFLARRLHARGVRMVGLYGVEERIGRTFSVLPEVSAARASIDRTAARLQNELSDIPGIYVEHKGLAVSVHFRRTADPADAFARAQPVVAAVAQQEGLAPVTRGRQVLEVGPRVAIDKGEVVKRLISERRLRAAIVIGDDSGDVAMFDALDGLEHAVRIAVMSEESPPELLARADIKLDGPAEVVKMLRGVASAPDR